MLRGKEEPVGCRLTATWIFTHLYKQIFTYERRYRVNSILESTSWTIIEVEEMTDAQRITVSIKTAWFLS